MLLSVYINASVQLRCMYMDMHIKYWRKGNEVPLSKLCFTWRLQFLFMWPKFWPILNVSTRPISNWWGNWSRTGVTLTQGQTSYNRETTTWKGSSKFQIHYLIGIVFYTLLVVFKASTVQVIQFTYIEFISFLQRLL